MKKPLPKIADSEWFIMKLLWNKEPQSASSIIENLKGKVEWNPRTIKTLLNRLVKKGAVGFEMDGRSYLYYPLVSEKECKCKEVHSFLNRVFDGTLKPMLAAFLEDSKLTKSEIEELRKFLDQDKGV